ncbi:Epoxide hydrolase A [Bienertia sinuspersici]
MDQIKHSHIEVRGLKLHIAETGTGSKVVILLHGFPEIWYTWRHQMIGLADAGFRAIAPDFRGYGLSDKPANLETMSFMDLVFDLLGIVDHLAISKVFLIAKDFGARPAYLFALQYPDRVEGVITVGVPYMPPRPSTFHKQMPEGFYISRWQEPGRAEADFGRFDAKTVVRKIYTMFSRSKIPIAKENQEILDLVGSENPLPSWFSEEDLANYGSLYEKSGFQAALQVPYRTLNEEYNILDPVLKLPLLTLIGEEDYTLKFPGMQEYITSGKAQEYAPESEIIYLPEASHFAHEQLPQVVNKLILNFLFNHASKKDD